MSLLVGLDAREGFRENPRGIGLYCRHLIREFGELAPDVHFLAYHEHPVPKDLPPLPTNVQPVRTEMRGNRFHLWERLRIPWQIRRDRVDVYHGTYNTLPPRWLPGGPPLVVSLHDVIVTWWPQDLAGTYVHYCRQVTPRVCRDAARILTVSEWSKRDICERYRVSEAKVEVFHNGIHPVFFQDPPPAWGEAARARFADGWRYLFAIGSPLERKNTGGLIRAVGRLRRSGRLQHRVVVTGLAPSERRGLSELAAAEGVAADVLFHGYVSREELVGLYAGADLTVYPSHAEGWGIPVVESLAVGTPVATSNATAMPEAGGEYAEYFDPRDPDDIADAIVRALEASRQDGFAARRLAAQQRSRAFTWRAAAETTLRVYREVVGR